VLLLWGRRKRQPVPFLPLWHGPVLAQSATRAMQPPPLALALAILAMLAAIMAASRPALRLSSSVSRSPSITIIVDRGATMSASGGWQATTVVTPMFAQLAKSVSESVRRTLGDGPVRLIEVPSGASFTTNRTHWAEIIAQRPSSAVETTEQLAATAARELLRDQSMVIVLSDRSLDISNPRLVQVAPSTPVRNVGLVRIAAAIDPIPQVMVGVGNQSPATEARLRISTGGQITEQPIALPPSGSQRNYFIAPPALGDVMEVTLVAAADLAADKQAFLVRRRWRPVEERPPLSEALHRMVEVYQHSRMPARDIAPVFVVQSPNELGSQECGVLLASLYGPGAATTLPTTLSIISSNPVTANVDWKQVMAGAMVASAPPAGDGWTPLVTVGSHILLAFRQAPERQVWVGFDNPSFVHQADYVIFWANVFDFLNGPGGYTSQSVGLLDAPWQARQLAPGAANTAAMVSEPGLWPGLYQLPDSSDLRAVNALDIKTAGPKAPTSDWQSRLADLSRGQVPLFHAAGPLLLFVVIAMVLSALTWRRARIIGQ